MEPPNSPGTPVLKVDYIKLNNPQDKKQTTQDFSPNINIAVLPLRSSPRQLNRAQPLQVPPRADLS